MIATHQPLIPAGTSGAAALTSQAYDALRQPLIGVQFGLSGSTGTFTITASLEGSNAFDTAGVPGWTPPAADGSWMQMSAQGSPLSYTLTADGFLNLSPMFANFRYIRVRYALTSGTPGAGATITANILAQSM